MGKPLHHPLPAQALPPTCWWSPSRAECRLTFDPPTSPSSALLAGNRDILRARPTFEPLLPSSLLLPLLLSHFRWRSCYLQQIDHRLRASHKYSPPHFHPPPPHTHQHLPTFSLCAVLDKDNPMDDDCLPRLPHLATQADLSLLRPSLINIGDSSSWG